MDLGRYDLQIITVSVLSFNAAIITSLYYNLNKII